nr:ferredoxin reductase [Acidiferrimicrobium sp. IK]
MSARTHLATVALGALTAAAGATAIEARRRVASRGIGALRPDTDLVRQVVARMTTPLLPDDYLHLLNPLWTAREVRGRVVRVVPETEDAATLVIRPGWGWSFDYQPGQYVGIGVSVEGRWLWRSYSITSAPRPDQRHFAVTVKAMPEGRLSGHLVRGLAPGTVVRLAVPQGGFVLPDPPPPRLLFWTGGSGVTPVMAMLRTLVRRGTMPDVVHVHAAPERSESLFADELRALADQHANYRLVEASRDRPVRVGDLERACPDWRLREAWVCGPERMLDDAEDHWRRAGLGDRLHLERFSASRTAEAEGGRITFAASDRVVEADGATSLLEAGEGAGVAMPFGCRMGICHTCVVPLASGAVQDLRNGDIYRDRQGIQTCVTAAAGDCTIDI